MRFRQLQTSLLNALGDTPVICLAGAARTGKSTLVKALQAELPASSWISLADAVARAEAVEDPAGFLERLPGLAFLDDVERVPALLPLLKPAVDRGGRFLLTTSGALPGLARDLTWRMESFTLWPLAQAELRGVFPGLIDCGFQGDPGRLRLEPLDHRELLLRVQAGGYPEAADVDPALREGWFHGYLGGLVRGALRDLTELREVRHLTRLLASPGADPGQAKRCLDILESIHVVASLASEAGAPYRRFNDAALQAHLLGTAPAALEARPMLAAPLLETFAVMELVKTAPWSQARPSLTHLRAGGQDLVLLEDRHGDLVAITTSASVTVQPEAFQGLRELRGRVGDRMKAGIVLHLGDALRSAGPGLWAAPFQALWAARA
jgi:hypothetical protein